MAEKGSQEPDEVDWSRVESRMRAKDGSSTEPGQLAYSLQAAGDPANSIVPPAIAVPLPDTDTPRGILMQWKRNQIDRKTALQAIQAQYDAQLDALRYQLQKAVNVSN